MKRPVPVTVAAAISIVMSALTAAGWVLIAIVWVAAKDQIYTEFRTQAESSGMTDSQFQQVTNGVVAFGLIAALICVVAIVTAVFSLKGANWARIVTVVLAALTALIGLLLITSVFSVLWLVAGVSAIILYFVGGANAWYSQRP